MLDVLAKRKRFCLCKSDQFATLISVVDPKEIHAAIPVYVCLDDLSGWGQRLDDLMKNELSISGIFKQPQIMN